MVQSPFRWLPAAFCLALVLHASAALAQAKAVRGAEPDGNPCGKIYTDHYGPFDYRNERGQIKIVEDFHYTPRVRAAIGGSTGQFGGDINYTLKASPNHHHALTSLVRWVERVKQDQTQGMEFPVDCYFDRALRFRPDDTVARALYAQFLAKRQRSADAVKQIDIAVTHAGDSPLSHYNLGLVYMELGEHDKALAQAHKALAMGYERPELRAALERAGRWRAPAPAEAAAAGPAASAASAAN